MGFLLSEYVDFIIIIRTIDLITANNLDQQSNMDSQKITDAAM